MTKKEEQRFAALAEKQGFKTLAPEEMRELKKLADKKSKETKGIKTKGKKTLKIRKVGMAAFI